MVELDGKAALVTADEHKLLLLEQDRPPIPVSGVVALLSFAAGAIASAVVAGRHPVMTWLIGYPLAAAVPLLYAPILQVWHGYDLDSAVLAVAIIASCLGCIAGRILARPASLRRADRPLGAVAAPKRHEATVIVRLRVRISRLGSA
jgi:hypothetical protein